MRRKNNDIAAPDGYVLGGVRRVRADGTILFHRGYWQAPKEWAGEDVWVHEEWVDDRGFAYGARANNLVLEAAPPGTHIYTARLNRTAIICERTDRPDAKPGVRLQWRKDWINRK